MLLFWLLACGNGLDTALGDTEDTDGGWEEIHRIGVQFSFSFPADDARSIHLLGDPYAATSAWILLGDTVLLDDRDEDEPYRIAARDDEDWGDYWAWFRDRGEDPFAVRIEGVEEDQSKYSVWDDDDIGLDEDVLAGWEVLGVDMTRSNWEEWDDGTVFTALQIRLLGVPD